MRRIQFFLLANILIPLFLGSFLYCLLSPEVILVKWADAYLGLRISLENAAALRAVFFFRFIRNHLMDMLWGYALVFALFFLSCRKPASCEIKKYRKDEQLVNKTVTSVLWKIFAISGIFSIMLEGCQLLPQVQGTFDLWDILLEFLAELLAVFMIKSYYVTFVEEEKK
jgi:hypothetical protein